MKKIIISLFLIVFFCSCLLAKEEYPFVGLVTHDKVNVRAGANTNFEILSKLAVNERVTVLSKSYEWYKISLPKDSVCYINERYVKITDSEYIVTANRVNLRAKPGENFTVIGWVDKGQTVKILKKTGNWYGIEPLGNCVGWVNEKFISYYSEFKKDDNKLQAKVTPALQLETKNIKSKLEKTKVVKSEQSIDKQTTAVGIVKPMGRVFKRSGTHKLMWDNKIIYILQGDRGKLDSFINYRVKIIGERLEIPSSKYPVIYVKQITACE
ncbi:MAG: SH3 domain-containing protein [Candidatus Omnitrophota bacterium]|nr:SH3 domain-containing protein [Candidatus Omnitrophota bacterium]